MESHLEPILADVFSGEIQRRAHHDFARLREHADLSDAGNVHAVARSFMAEHHRTDSGSQAAKLAGIPKRNRLYCFAFDVVTHQIWRREPGDGNLAGESRLLDSAGDGWRGGGTVSDKSPQVWIGLQQALRLHE